MSSNSKKTNENEENENDSKIDKLEKRVICQYFFSYLPYHSSSSCFASSAESKFAWILVRVFLSPSDGFFRLNDWLYQYIIRL